MMKKIKQTNQKPIDRDASFRYICPNIDCGFDHWLSLKQTQTKNFKIVCDCGTIFKPKRILKIKIIYKKHQKKNKNNRYSISKELEDNCISVLSKYGFSEQESKNLVIKAYSKTQESNASVLVKYILSNITTLETTNE